MTIIDVQPDVINILRVFREATVEELAEGMSWYDDAHALAASLSPDDVAKGAGVIAALSPMLAWDRNMMLAVRAFSEGAASGVLSLNVAKADAILAGAAPLDVLGGDKVRAFFQCIADPTSNAAVCIDRHAFDIAVGQETNDQTRTALGRVGVYATFAESYRTAAEYLTVRGDAISAAQMQAVTWVTWRRMKGE